MYVVEDPSLLHVVVLIPVIQGDISAFNARGGRSVFNPGNCQGVLNSIAKQCPPVSCFSLSVRNQFLITIFQGGSFTPDAFTFTLDPNAGPCPSGVQGSN